MHAYFGLLIICIQLRLYFILNLILNFSTIYCRFSYLYSYSAQNFKIKFKNDNDRNCLPSVEVAYDILIGFKDTKVV